MIGPNGLKTYYESSFKSNEKIKFKQNKIGHHDLNKLDGKALSETGSLFNKTEANLCGDDSPPSPSMSNGSEIEDFQADEDEEDR